MLHIIQFNDVYNAFPVSDKQVPLGGADRMTTVVRQIQNICHPNQPVIVFCGDLLSPSIHSCVTKGKHMMTILEEIGAHIAVIGNHDIDFGVEHATETLRFSNGNKWILSNIINNDTGGILCDVPPTDVVTLNGKSIGFMGVVSNWTDCFSMPPEQGCTYIDYVDAARTHVSEFQAQEGIDYIIALTHSRVADDMRLAENVDGIDIILGGHDHTYHAMQGPKPYRNVLVKSATDFRWLSWITICDKDVDLGRVRDLNGRLPFYGKNTESFYFETNRHNISVLKIDVVREIEPNPRMFALATELIGEVDKRINERVGSIACEMDATNESVRSRESPVGNLICDLLRRSYHTDAAFVHGGCIRANCVFPAGDISMRGISSLFPYSDTVVCVLMTGAQIWKTLEFALCQLPALSGQFLQVSGVRIQFDPACDAGDRLKRCVIQKYGESDWEEVTPDSDVLYRVGTPSTLCEGLDGFEEFAKCEKVVDEEEGITFSVLLRNFFWQVETCNRLANLAKETLMATGNDSTFKELAEKAQRAVDRYDMVTVASVHSLKTTGDESKEGDFAFVILDEYDDEFEEKAELTDDVLAAMPALCVVHPECDGRIMTTSDAKALGALDEGARVSAIFTLVQGLPSFAHMEHQPSARTLRNMVKASQL